MAVIPFPHPLNVDSFLKTDASPPDAAERAHALEISASWITEAPAGSGKTGLLIQRYLKLLATVQHPAEVLALTFTQKATAEMRGRIVTALGDAAGSGSPDNDFQRLTQELARDVLRRDRELGWSLLTRPHLLNIRTIDSLCSEIARGVPLVDGGIGFARPVPDAEPLYRRAAHAVMMRFGGEDAALNDAVRVALLHRDGDLSYCEKVLAEMLGTREQWNRLFPLETAELSDAYLDASVLPRLNGALQRTLCAELGRLHRCFPEEALARVAQIAQELAYVDGHNGLPSRFLPCASLSAAPGPEAGHLDHWLLMAGLLLTAEGEWRKGFAVNSVGARVEKRLASELKDLIAGLNAGLGGDEVKALLHAVRSLPPDAYPAAQWLVAKAFFRLLQYALAELQSVFGREEVCDFTALSIAARNALKSRTYPALAPRHVLVDEMQDTSSAQYELLEALTAGWDGHRQTVFLVGDPKQSIYLFRQARVDLFQRTLSLQTLGGVPVKPLRLSANFRSGRQTVERFNEIFAKVFPAENPSDGDVTYSLAVPVLPAAQDGGVAWEVDLLPAADDLVSSRRQRQRAMIDEAEEIASRIHGWREQYGCESRIAVLTRTRSHVSEITKAFKRAGIPYRATEIEPLGERREVLDMQGITRALLHPADRTAWLAVLRAPWCGASLADLFTLAAGDDAGQRKQSPRIRFRERLGALPEPPRARIARTLDVLDAALQHSGAASLADRVERTWRALGGDACVDEAGQENIRMYLRVLDAMEREDEAVTAESLGRRMERLFAEPSHAAHAVDVMTIHKAKGLEWDLVLVPGMHRAGAQDRFPFLNWLELPTYADDGIRDVLLAPLPAKGGDAGLLNRYIALTRRRRADAELKRVFYVAATRARTSLHLFAWPETNAGGSASRINGTLLKAAYPAALPHQRVITAGVGTSQQTPAMETLALAAAAEPPGRRAVEVERLPDDFNPAGRFKLPSLAQPGSLPVADRRDPFTRPEGSFAARAAGSTMHAFLERLANEFSMSATRADETADELLAQLPGWSSPIRALLRSHGLPPGEVERATKTVAQALGNTLRSKEGRWLLLPHAGAQTEGAWSSYGTEADTLRVRLDRTFFAGPEPLAAGDGTLWIVDFKTADRSEGVEQFIAEENARYKDQLEAYAEVRRRSLPEKTPVMLALYYPLMDRLVCWPDRLTSNWRTTSHSASGRGAAGRLQQMSLFAGG